MVQQHKDSTKSHPQFEKKILLPFHRGNELAYYGSTNMKITYSHKSL
jgi:hypothetical protein